MKVGLAGGKTKNAVASLEMRTRGVASFEVSNSREFDAPIHPGGFRAHGSRAQASRQGRDWLNLFSTTAERCSTRFAQLQLVVPTRHTICDFFTIVHERLSLEHILEDTTSKELFIHSLLQYWKI